MHPYLRHLRLPFNLLLSPIYLWGVLLAEGSLRAPAFWLGYVALHLFLYGGTTALNSYYDRDEGPVGGMLTPPPVDRGLLPFALAVQALGLLVALAVGLAFALSYLALFVVATAYSHPLTRLKAKPAAALLAVALGQGGIGFAAGWLAVRPELASLLSSAALSGMLTAALLVSGLYIITQSYQTAEDRGRGDRTLPVVLGPKRALRLALAILTLGGIVLLALTARRFGLTWTLLLGAGFATVGAALWRWAHSFSEADVIGNFKRAMWLTALSSGGLSLFLLAQLGRL